MSGHADVLGSAAIVILGLMVGTWVVSLVRRDAGIAAIAWGAGIGLVSWISAGVGDGHSGRSDLLVAMVTIWGLRLSAHLWWRNRAGGEDQRYQALRRRAGERFAVRSLVTLFLLQGAIMWVVSLPMQLAMTPADPDIGALRGRWCGPLGDRVLLRDRRRRPTRPFPGRSGERGAGDGPRSVARHPASQLLR